MVIELGGAFPLLLPRSEEFFDCAAYPHEDYRH
jgi:hypothetical protein